MSTTITLRLSLVEAKAVSRRLGLQLTTKEETAMARRTGQRLEELIANAEREGAA